MGRKTNLQLLQEALEKGDLEKAKELTQKLGKNHKEKDIVVVNNDNDLDVEERPIVPPKKTIKRIAAARQEGASTTKSGSDKPCRIESININRKPRFIDTNEFQEESVKKNPKLGTKVSPRNRPAATYIEAQCNSCQQWFEISESAYKLSGDHWRCSRCCKG